MNAPEQPDDTAAAAPKPISNLESVKNAVEMLSKIILGTAAVCFVCGIIVVNLYLREYGVASFSLFRVSYITAGIWAFSPMAFAGLLVGTFFSFYFQGEKSQPPPSGWKKWGKILAAAVSAVSVFVFIFSGFGIPFDWRWLGAIIIGFFIESLGIAVIMVLLREGTSNKWLSASGALVCLVAFLGYLLSLAPSLYKEIPASVGGGAGMPVVLIVSEDKQDLAKAAGITFTEPFRTNQMTLLLQTDKEYVVLAGDPKEAITLTSDLISAIRHVPQHRK